MDALFDCIRIAKEVQPKYNIELSIIEDNEMSLMPSYNNGIISFPAYQEALLILNEIGNLDQFLCFYYAIFLLRSDDYESCEELVNWLVKTGMPNCHDAGALYRSILTKQLFTMFHEYGHYLCITDEWREPCTSLFEKLINQIREQFSNTGHIPLQTEVDSEYNKKYKSVLMKSINCSENEADSMLNYLGGLNHLQSINALCVDSDYSEEWYADLIAMILLDDFIKKESELFLDVNVKEAVMDTAYLINVIIAIKDKLEQIINMEKGKRREFSEKQLEKQSNVDSTRMLFIESFVGNINDGYNISEDYHLRKAREMFSVFKLLPKYNRFIESWYEGSGNKRKDQAKYCILKSRIDEYSKSLKKLYHY